ncbi:MAG TPA: diguanylate cyclase [Kofleriaceae bacterium]
MGATDSFKKPADLPDDLADAAEAALDDLLSGGSAMDRSASIPIDIDDVAFDTSANPIVEPPPPAPVAKRVPVPPSSKKPTSRAKTLPPPAESEIFVVDETELPQIPELHVAVYEHPDHLASAQAAIAANGHVVAVGASGTSGLSKVADQIVAGLDVVLVALPGGEPVIDIALAQDPRRPIVIASVSGKKTEAVKRAIAAGADLITTRPHDPDRIAPALLAAARLHVERKISQNARGSEAVLRAKLEELQDPDIRGLQPFETFQRVLELEFKRAKRFEYPLSVALFAVDVPPPPPPAGIRGILRARAGNALIHTIRDIDLATQLDHERFLVLLPYTDLTGAAGLGRRVIEAVAKGDPVVSAGRSFTPRVVGAVAGAQPGHELSFAKLMKDASQALAQARRDGADLAVQP